MAGLASRNVLQVTRGRGNVKAGDREEVARGEGGKVSSGNQVQVPKSAELTREEEGNSGNSCFERVVLG